MSSSALVVGCFQGDRNAAIGWIAARKARMLCCIQDGSGDYSPGKGAEAAGSRYFLAGSQVAGRLIEGEGYFMPHFKGTHSEIFYEQTGNGADIVWVGGGGTVGRDWQRFQTPHFDKSFRSTTFDNRGVGQTTCHAAMPWPIEAFSDDLAELAQAVCDGPAIFIGNSLGAAIVQQVLIDHPEVVRAGIVMGTGAWSTGWGWDYQEAEIEFRKAGGRLDGLMAVTHYAAMLYPARVLGDRELWPKLKAMLLEWVESGEGEDSVISQWEASLRFDQRAQLSRVRVPTHVVAFGEDIMAPPQDGEELAQLIPGAEFHLLEGMGHTSHIGHAHHEINAFLEGLARRYV
jgi:pimeloyl-ACP methyl ester carboxylesterase